MAKFDESVVAHLLLWEVSYVAKKGESAESMYRNASRDGFHIVKGDKGGATMCGVTLSTYQDYCRRNGLPKPDAEALKRLPYSQWRDIAKRTFWDRVKGDSIRNQSIALVVMDWVWTSGVGGIKGVQRAVGATPDGIIGNQTLAMLNSGDAVKVFQKLCATRESFYVSVAKKPGQARFLNGWLNRARSIQFRV